MLSTANLPLWLQKVQPSSTYRYLIRLRRVALFSLKVVNFRHEIIFFRGSLRPLAVTVYPSASVLLNVLQLLITPVKEAIQRIKINENIHFFMGACYEKVMPTAIVRYHEIALKGGNRDFFESRLKQNLERVFDSLPGTKIRRERGYLAVEFMLDEHRPQVIERLSRVFGVAHFYCIEEILVPSFQTGEGWLDGALQKVADHAMPLIQTELHALKASEALPVSFRVQVHRRDKRIPGTSLDLERALSQWLLPRLSFVRVDLENPDVVLYVDWFLDHVQLFVSKLAGPGGLPVGSSGKLVALLSAGFDSPVACARMMRRGAKIVFAHFHSYPATSRVAIDHVRELVYLLNRYQFESKLYLFPLIDFQKAVVTNAPAEYRILLYRRMMLRVAQRLLCYERAKGIVTGESLGQVASQTLDNLHTVDVLSEWPIYRPLIGMDKQEIIQAAREIGTHDVSAQPSEDCCSLYADRSPALAADPETLEAVERDLDIFSFENAIWEAHEGEKIVYSL